MAEQSVGSPQRVAILKAKAMEDAAAAAAAAAMSEEPHGRS